PDEHSDLAKGMVELAGDTKHEEGDGGPKPQHDRANVCWRAQAHPTPERLAIDARDAIGVAHVAAALDGRHGAPEAERAEIGHPTAGELALAGRERRFDVRRRHGHSAKILSWRPAVPRNVWPSSASRSRRPTTSTTFSISRRSPMSRTTRSCASCRHSRR